MNGRGVWIRTLSAAAVALAVTACGGGGAEEPPPTGPTVAGFELSSPAFGDQGAIPLQYTCEGDNISPPLQWSGVPEGTQELALTMIDVDADGFIHWIAWGIDPTTDGLEEGSVPAGTAEAGNSSGSQGYFGPCPPGDSPHRYVFTLHALPGELILEDGTAGPEAFSAIELAEPIAVAELTGLFPAP
jgi:hypothetical protein